MPDQPSERTPLVRGSCFAPSLLPTSFENVLVPFQRVASGSTGRASRPERESANPGDTDSFAWQICISVLSPKIQEKIKTLENLCPILQTKIGDREPKFGIICFLAGGGRAVRQLLPRLRDLRRDRLGWHGFRPFTLPEMMRDEQLLRTFLVPAARRGSGAAKEAGGKKKCGNVEVWAANMV